MEFSEESAKLIRECARLRKTGFDPMFDQFIAIARLLIQRDDFPCHVVNRGFTPLTAKDVDRLLFGAPAYCNVKPEE